MVMGEDEKAHEKSDVLPARRTTWRALEISLARFKYLHPEIA